MLRTLALLAATGVFVLPLAAQDRGGGGIPRGDCVSPEQTKAILARVEAFRSKQPSAPGIASVDPERYPFQPFAGNLWDDVHTFNFVDLDPSFGLRDFDCLQWTYDTHRGHDTHLHSFAEMDRGVPVFAAIAGVVVDLHDGEPDRNINPSSLPSNYVILWHGGTHYSWYLHLRRNSVAVTLGQRVAGGQQLGLVGSSGNSSWPHLHFESWHDNAHYEPDAGVCRAGASRWVNPIARRRGAWVSDLNIGPGDFHAQPRLPNDYVRQGRWGTGWQYIGFWFQYHDLPPNTTARVRWLRPDDSVAIDSGAGPFGNPAGAVWDWVWFRWWVFCDVVGSWRIEIELNGAVVATMPFDVYTDPLSSPNRPPEPLQSIRFEPAQPSPGDVLFCRVAQGLLRDRDQDLVTQRYLWRINGAIVRDVTHAGRADCLRDDALRPGDLVTCAVTPNDGLANGATRTVSASVAQGACLALSLRGHGHADGSGKPLALGPGARDVGFAPDAGAMSLLAISLQPCGVGLPLGQFAPCTLPAAILLPDPVQGPLLTVGGAALAVPAILPWCFCVQGIELSPLPGGLGFCLKATHGYHLIVRC
ncbi:MAG: M23 family metallopeptidase [Planctomycetes bacterium]|nr:M23 family metallopeptidase [Planctomycetota bacterium]